MITNAFSQENTVYRIGGDEFCVIMPDAKENSIEEAMDRLKELQKQYKGTDHSVEVEIACGYRSMMTMWIRVLWIQERGQIRICMKISVC